MSNITDMNIKCHNEFCKHNGIYFKDISKWNKTNCKFYDGVDLSVGLVIDYVDICNDVKKCKARIKYEKFGWR